MVSLLQRTWLRSAPCVVSNSCILYCSTTQVREGLQFCRDIDVTQNKVIWSAVNIHLNVYLRRTDVMELEIRCKMLLNKQVFPFSSVPVQYLKVCIVWKWSNEGEMSNDTCLWFRDCLPIPSLFFPRMLRKWLSVDHESILNSVHLLEEVWYCMKENQFWWVPYTVLLQGFESQSGLLDPLGVLKNGAELNQNWMKESHKHFFYRTMAHRENGQKWS